MHILALPYLPSRDRKSTRLRVEQWRWRNRERQEALNAVTYALKKYDIDRKPCEDCGTDQSCADEISLHPLRVVWRCRRCINTRRRREIRTEEG
jgi:RNA polymerase-binding transcription factor DksA